MSLEKMSFCFKVFNLCFWDENLDIDSERTPPAMSTTVKCQPHQFNLNPCCQCCSICNHDKQQRGKLRQNQQNQRNQRNQRVWSKMLMLYISFIVITLIIVSMSTFF